jgi:hypothetical protein
VTAAVAAGYFLAAAVFAAVPTNHAGWPVTFSTPGAPVLGDTSVQIVDLYGDGTRRVVLAWIAYGGYPGSVEVLRPDGSLEMRFDFNAISMHPAFVDLDGDGVYEIVAGRRDGVVVFDAAGRLLWERTRVDGDPIWGNLTAFRPSIAELDGDGEPWIVGPVTGFRFYVFDRNGNLRAGFPIGGFTSFSAATIADLDNDGRPEMLSGDGWGKINCYDRNGSVCPGWPYVNPLQQHSYYSGSMASSLIVASRDVLGDVALYAVSDDNSPVLPGLHSIDRFGQPISPFPIVREGVGGGGMSILEAYGTKWAVTGGLNYDGGPIGIGEMIDLATGLPAPGWPIRTQETLGGCSVAAGDLGQAGPIGLLFEGWQYSTNRVDAFDFNGSHLSGYPRVISQNDYVNTIALGTLDGIETTACWTTGAYSGPSSQVDCFDVGVPWSRDKVQWGTYGFDLQHTSFFRRLWQIDRSLTCLTTTAPTAPVAGAAFDVVVSPLDKTGAGLGPDQEVRFARRPVVGRFEGPVIYDAANGTYRRRYVSDPCSTAPYDIEFRVFVNEELDDSMPVVHFEPRSVSVDHPTYRCSQPVALRVADGAANVDPAVAETLAVQATSGSEPAGEPVTVTETGPNTGVFSGSIPLSTVDAAGTLLVSDGDTIEVRYTAAAGSCPGLLVTTATVDCAAPVISGVAVADETPTSASIRWTTSEPGTSVVEWGTSPSLGSSASASGLDTSHSVPLSGLTICVPYFFRVRSVDAAENAAVDDNGGALYSFTLFPSYQRTASTPTVLFPADGTTGVPLTSTLSWSPSTDVSRYEIWLGTTSPPPVVAEASAAATSWPLVLSSGTAYVVQVVAFPSDGSNPPTPSPVVFFTTADSPALGVTAATPTVVNRWGGPIAMTISGNGFDAASTFESVRPGHSAGVFAGTPATPASVDGAFTPDPLAPAGWYELRLVQGGAFVAGTPHAFVLRAFADVTENDWYFEASERMVSEGILPGFAGPYGPEFRPTIPLTRAEITQAVVRAHFWQLGGTPPLRTCLSPYFPDVPCSLPQRNEIEWAKDLGIALGGADGNFHPDSLVTRAEMAALVVRLLYNGEPKVPKCQLDPGWSDLAEIPDWSEPYVNLLRAKRLTAGCQASPLAFCSLGNVQRSDLAVFLGRAVGEVKIK